MNKRILIVEDEVDLRELLKLVLQDSGYIVQTLSNGNKLLSSAYDAPDLYIIDINLPGISGLEICTHLKSKEHTKDIPVIIISANPELSGLSKDAMADDYIQKPLNKDTLLKKVGYVLK
jgi:DNA-binding response OmpR family regulator